MAAKKKKTKKRARKAAPKRKATKKRVAKRRPAKRRTAAKRAGPRVVRRSKVGGLKVTVQKSGTGFTAKAHSPCGGSMNVGTGATPAQALSAGRTLLGRGKSVGGSGAIHRRRLKALCGS